MPRKLKRTIDIDQLVELYESGESENSLSKYYECSRRAIRSRLVAASVHIRNSSEANIESAKRASVESRKLRSKAANNASRGRTQSNEHRIKIANYNEKHANRNQSRYERMFSHYLTANNINFKPQKAFERYNIDFAFEEKKIALEIFGGVWHGSGRKVSAFNRKSSLLLDAGWSIVVVWCRGGMDEAALFEYVNTIEDKEPKHHVISGFAKRSKIGSKKITYRL